MADHRSRILIGEWVLVLSTCMARGVRADWEQTGWVAPALPSESRQGLLYETRGPLNNAVR